jgi:hypothetical protein
LWCRDTRIVRVGVALEVDFDTKADIFDIELESVEVVKNDPDVGNLN